MNEPPPPVIGSARLLEYAKIDSAMVFTGRSVIYVDGKLLGPVPRLAVCQDIAGPGVILYHCDEEWDVLAVTSDETLVEAKERAERDYLGLAGKWLVSPYTEEETDRFWEKEKAVLSCSFCQRSFWDVNKLVTNEETGAAICDGCIDSLYTEIHS